MSATLKGRHFVSILDFSADEIMQVLKTAAALKGDPTARGKKPLKRKTLGMIFQKPSLRTRVSFEAGMTQLGGHAIYLAPTDISLGKRETTEDIALVLSRYVDAIMARVFGHNIVEELAKFATVPVINGLSDLEHPCQILADFQTIRERKGRLDGIKLCYIGDGNNVAHSLVLLAAVLGFRMQLATPASHAISSRVRQRAEELAKASGAEITWTEDPTEAVAGADFVYTDSWTSMGQEDEAEARRKIFAPYQVNTRLLEACPQAWVMHCMPAHRGEEITDEVLDGPRSLVYDQAENRLHSQKAILERVMG